MSNYALSRLPQFGNNRATIGIDISTMIMPYQGRISIQGGIGLL